MSATRTQRAQRDAYTARRVHSTTRAHTQRAQRDAYTARRVHSATRTQHDAYTAHPNAARTFHAVVADVKGGANVEGGAVAAAPLDKAVIDGHRLHKAAHCRRRSGSGDGGARGLVGWLRRGQVLARETRRRNEGLIIVHRLRSSERSWGV